MAEPDFAQGVNLGLHVGFDINISAYAMTRVYSPRRTHVSALIGAARFDAHRLWHNGELIYEDLQSTVQGKWRDEGNIAVTLQPGWNTFLAKVVNVPFREQGYYLYFRLSDDPVFLARAYERLEDSEQALAALNGFLGENPDSSHLNFTRALTQWRLGNTVEGDQDFQLASRELGLVRIAALLRECGGPKVLELLSEALRVTPENAGLRAFRADRLCSLGRWEEALADELELAKLDEFAYRAESLTLLLALCAREEEYQQQRQVLLEQIRAKAQDMKAGAGDAQQIVACMVLPGTPEEMQEIEAAYEWYPVLPVYALADRHVRSRKWIEGLLAYRQNNWQRAIELLTDATKYETDLQEYWMVEHARRRAAACTAYLAMAQFRLNRVAEAKATLQGARDLHEQRDVDWGAAAYTELALREAEELIGK